MGVEPSPGRSWTSAWIWVAGAVVSWLVSVMIAWFTAADIGDLPQPNQQLWIMVVLWSPTLPILSAIVVATILVALRRSWRLITVAAAQGLLWPSIGLALLLIPKPP
jgi:hypothetical protein